MERDLGCAKRTSRVCVRSSLGTAIALQRTDDWTNGNLVQALSTWTISYGGWGNIIPDEVQDGQSDDESIAGRLGRTWPIRRSGALRRLLVDAAGHHGAHDIDDGAGERRDCLGYGDGVGDCQATTREWLACSFY